MQNQTIERGKKEEKTETKMTFIEMRVFYSQSCAFAQAILLAICMLNRISNH